MWGQVLFFAFLSRITRQDLTPHPVNNRQLPKDISDVLGAEVAINQSYTYDYQGNITRLIDNARSGFSLNSLTYDALDRLKTTTDDTDTLRASLSYDSLGNITYYKTINTTLNYQYNETTKRLDTTTGSKAYNFNYDNRGNVTDNGFRAFTFNRANQLTSSETNSYIYDGHNRRVKTTDSKGTSYSLYSMSGTLLYRETDVDTATNIGDGINYIYLGKKLIAKEGVMPVATDSVMHYKPFGESLGDYKDDIGYTGHKFDVDLGLSYMQARYYDPVIGRFYSNDPVDAATFISEGNIQGFNRYAYANNNPYRYTDPTGESGVELEKVIMDTKLIENDGNYEAANTATNQELDKVNN